jgi:uncharacterized membrane protein
LHKFNLELIQAPADSRPMNALSHEILINLQRRSPLFILAKKAEPKKIVAELKRYDGKILQTSIAHEDGTRLQAALDSALKEKHP